MSSSLKKGILEARKEAEILQQARDHFYQAKQLTKSDS
jgi:hypothetical protein